MKLTPTTFIIADTHFYHKNIVAYEGRPEDYNELIVRNWNHLVTKKDTVLHLGDLHLTNFTAAYKIISKLNGHKYLIRGNHDGASETHYHKLGFEIIEPIYKRFTNSHGTSTLLFTHEPVQGLPEKWFNVHGHIHLNQHRDIPLTKRHINMSVEVIDYTPVPLYDILSKIKGGFYEAR
jgi:calcineurin-like phosphoesterase family protein